MFVPTILKFFHDCRFFLKLTVLIFTLSYYCILQNSSRGSEFNASKEYCISETDLCVKPNEDYHSARVDNLPYGICYAGRVDNLCLENQAVSCLYFKRNRHRGVELEDEVIPIQHEYFLYSVPIIVFTVLASLGTLLFQTRILGVSFVQDESAFSSRKLTEFFVDKFISVCSVIVFSLIIVSGSDFDFMVTEKCDTSSPSTRTDFCQDLVQCDVNIRSIIAPTEWVATEYRVMAFVLGLCVLVIEIYTFIFPPVSQDDILEEYSHHIRQMNIHLASSSLRNEESGGALVYIVQTPRGSRVSRTYMSSSALSPRASQVLSPTRYIRQHQVFKRTNRINFKKWKFNVPVATLSEEAECSICLECFHKDKNSDKVNINANNSSRDVRSTPRTGRGPSALVYPVETDDDVDEDGVSVSNAQFESSLQSIVRIPCGHTFHEICIFEWARENSTCPVCRAETTTGDNVDV